MKSVTLLLVLNFVVVNFGFSGSPSKDIQSKVRLNEISGRIFGGNEALDEQFPYQVGLDLRVLHIRRWCGGALIGRKWVLTSGVCLDRMETGQVYLGVHNIYATHEIGRQIVNVSKENFIFHPTFNEGTYLDDIALIHLPVEARISRDIQLIDLPDSFDIMESFVGETVVTSGWGEEGSDSELKLSPVLRYTDVEVISNPKCDETYKTRIRWTNMCTSGAEGKSPCLGDSGGPLVYEKNKTKTIIGVFSFVVGCEKGVPAVFTRVLPYLNWIREIMRKKSKS